ncbi:hypothetical protein [Bacillus sp. EAC]|uniref:hypothetical protein n=1 Tax=Bacillus sp. EAC TaxID=1978338 RepID=UPI000B431B59|nr:hypothetical protein [Bacillus sp. EAC]
MTEQEIKEYRANVIKSIEEEIVYYENLIKITRHSKRKERHMFNLNFMKELLSIEKENYDI